ncbi:hypothetical protein [Paenibacillus oleatilyticus]|uniref:hypothetical protein n=1 Tax=Paenibacillus oleatilyticus TaxID=2594886 RepID=UPI001C1FAA22|nr:hypothetical protein [Paenibacillus oleatilyticus]MBU7316655.1 hypothetical protein [Paenibacillus oleatilyticus]
MKQPWKTALTFVIIGTTLLPANVPALAADTTQTTMAAPSNFGLTDSIRAAVKSLAIETTAGGTRIGASVRLYNGGTQKTRVPDHQVHVRTTGGVQYTLKASAANKAALEPGEIGELVYMTVIEGTPAIKLSELSFVNVDEYVYPKKETNLLTIPLGARQVWYASAAGADKAAEPKGWGEAFTIPGLNSSLRYTPAAIKVQYPISGASAGASGTPSGGASAGAASGGTTGGASVPEAGGAAAAPDGAAAASGSAPGGASGASTGTPAAAPNAAGEATGPVALVTLLVENPGVGRETVPEFRIDGQSENKTYTGSRTEHGAVMVEAGEKKYIHFAIPVEHNVTLTSLFVTTTETFVSGGGQGTPTTATGFDVGRVQIAVPGGAQTDTAPAISYRIGSPIVFDSLNKMIDANTEVTLMEMHLHESDNGFHSVVAKFRITNKSDKPVPVPAFQTEILGGDGAAYAGARQSGVATALNPNMSYVVNYSFNVPKTENGKQLTIKLLDTQSTAPYTSTIASLQTAASSEAAGDTFAMYPFDLKIVDWTLSATTSPGMTGLSYGYKLSFTLDVKQTDNVVVDQNFSRLYMELVDSQGRMLGTAEGPFTGPNKLITGKQILTFTAKTDQLENPFTIRVYEAFDTPSGLAKRYITTLKQ